MRARLFLWFYLLCGILALIGVLAYVWWGCYPSPYSWLSGGDKLITLLLLSGITVGPVLTGLVIRRRRSTRELLLDLSLVALIQIGAVVAGVLVGNQSRPVALVFEYSLFRVVHANELGPDIASGRVDWFRHVGNQLPLHAMRAFKSPREQMDLTISALNGVPLATHSDMWVDYSSQREVILKSAKPWTDLQSQGAIKENTFSPMVENLVYIPVVGRRRVGVALLDPKSAQIVHVLNVNPFETISR